MSEHRSERSDSCREMQYARNLSELRIFAHATAARKLEKISARVKRKRKRRNKIPIEW
jgi:hypothetical protein